MKQVFRVLDTIGWEKAEVSDDFLVVVPYTAVPPLTGLKFDQSQTFDWTNNMWKEVMLPDVQKRIEELEKGNASLAESNAKLETTIAEITADSETTRQSIYELMLLVYANNSNDSEGEDNSEELPETNTPEVEVPGEKGEGDTDSSSPQENTPEETNPDPNDAGTNNNGSESEEVPEESHTSEENPEETPR